MMINTMVFVNQTYDMIINTCSVSRKKKKMSAVGTNKSWKTSAVSTTDWMVETQLCKLRVLCVTQWLTGHHTTFSCRSYSAPKKIYATYCVGIGDQGSSIEDHNRSGNVNAICTDAADMRRMTGAVCDCFVRCCWCGVRCVVSVGCVWSLWD